MKKLLSVFIISTLLLSTACSSDSDDIKDEKPPVEKPKDPETPVGPSTPEKTTEEKKNELEANLVTTNETINKFENSEALKKADAFLDFIKKYNLNFPSLEFVTSSLSTVTGNNSELLLDNTFLSTHIGLIANYNNSTGSYTFNNNTFNTVKNDDGIITIVTDDYTYTVSNFKTSNRENGELLTDIKITLTENNGTPIFSHTLTTKVDSEKITSIDNNISLNNLKITNSYSNFESTFTTYNLVKIDNTTILEIEGSGDVSGSTNDNLILNSSNLNINVGGNKLKLDIKDIDETIYDSKENNDAISYINDNTTIDLVVDEKTIASGVLKGDIKNKKDLGITFTFSDNSIVNATSYFGEELSNILTEILEISEGL